MDKKEMNESDSSSSDSQDHTNATDALEIRLMYKNDLDSYDDQAHELPTKLYFIGAHAGFGKSTITSAFPELIDIDDLIATVTLEADGTQVKSNLATLNKHALDTGDWKPISDMVSHKLRVAIESGAWNENNVLMGHGTDQINYWLDDNLKSVQFVMLNYALDESYLKKLVEDRSKVDPLRAQVTEHDWRHMLEVADMIFKTRAQAYTKVLQVAGSWLDKSFDPEEIIASLTDP